MILVVVALGAALVALAVLVGRQRHHSRRPDPLAGLAALGRITGRGPAP